MPAGTQLNYIQYNAFPENHKTTRKKAGRIRFADAVKQSILRTSAGLGNGNARHRESH